MTSPATAAPSAPAGPALLASLLLMGCANSVLFSIMPPVGRQLGFAEWQVGAIVAISAVAYMVAAAWWGRISDLRGRRYVVVAGMAGFGVGGLAFAAVLEAGLTGAVPAMACLAILMIVRFVQSAASGGVYPAVQAYIADRTPADRRAVAMSAVTAAFALGTIIGPGAAGLLVEIRITSPLYLIGLLGLATAGWCLASMARGIAAASPDRPRLSPRDPRVVVWIAVGVAYFVCVAGTQQILAFAVQDRLSLDAAATARVTSWMFMGGGTVAVLFQVLVVRRSTLSTIALMVFGLTAMALLQIVLLAAREEWHFLLAALPMGIAFACVLPSLSASVSLAVDPGEQGAAAGLMAAAQAAGFLIGPLLLALLYQLAPALPFLLGLGVILALILFAVSRRSLAR